MRLDKRLYVVATICYFTLPGVLGFEGHVRLTHDGPTVQGGTITFRADLFHRQSIIFSETYDFEWTDDAVPQNSQVTKFTKNATNIWKAHYPVNNPVGEYSVQVVVRIHKPFLIFDDVTSQHSTFKITSLLNGNMSVHQSNTSVVENYVSNSVETEMRIDLRKGDAEYIHSKATEISTFWFVDCKPYGQTNDFTFRYNFSKPDTSASVEALIVVSYDPPTTTVAPTTTTSPSNSTTVSPPSNATTPKPTVTTQSSLTTTSLSPMSKNNSNGFDARNISFPFVCINSTEIAPSRHKTYGYFHAEVKVRAPIHNITVEGTNWIKPWELLSLNVTCHGSPPFYKCLEYYTGNYNITGNETCDNGVHLDSCNFNITHYFLDPTVYTILMILKNNISTQVYPLTINIYEVTAKPQLSFIVVPVSCSLAAVVAIVFGVAYYIQSRTRFTIEVADFDFGQSNPDMEYKTFTERLRSSLNNTGYKPLGNPETIQD